MYNGELVIQESLDSILNQTFKDFELLVINDGSTDKCAEKVKAYADPRIRLVHNEVNMSLVPTLNKGIQLAKGEYIIRMDQDDVCLETRFEKQVEFMDLNPDVVVCGTWFELMNTGQVIKHPTTDKALRVQMFINTPLAHPTVIIRKNILIENNLEYDNFYKNGEDYEFWYRLSKFGLLANLPEVLLRYRVHSNQITQKYSAGNRTASDMIRTKILEELMGTVTEEEKNTHFMTLVHHSRETPLESLNWIERLNNKNGKRLIYDTNLFEKMLAEYWVDLIQNSNKYSPKIAWLFIKSPFKKYLTKGLMYNLKFIAKSFVKWKRN